ncbi:MAG: hypothetical protein IPF92_11580 [Myxococcales bacterium]|jgi:hypothetical protein|nr:hypothetical protein [Myxococcales bacterium]MBL0198282.1 hypothetical protein [Myxococcales bacterium]HQY64368.1 hypothetical protein [Polyangiaceae bacterium]
MWVRGAAIRPVPAFAVVGRAVVDGVERALSQEGDTADRELARCFERFEKTQPEIARRANELLSRPLDETALALGYFLTVAVWLAFDRSFRGRLEEVSAEALCAAEAALALEEELRATHADEPLELDDVMAIEQPSVVGFVHEHVDAALEGPAEDGEVDVDDVDLVYKLVLLETLALSHAVTAPDGPPRGREELEA